MARTKSGIDCTRMLGNDLGKRLFQLRTRSGYSRKYIADQIGVSENHISMIEKGEKMPSTPVFLGFLKILDCSPDELLFDYLGSQGDPMREHNFALLLDQFSENDRTRVEQICSVIIDSEEKSQPNS